MIDPSLVPALLDVLMVARAGSVGAAAKQLHKTPSAVSQQVRRVEEHFGVLLFERAGRGIRLSSSGEAALSAINRLFDEAEALFGHLSDLAGTSVTTLRIAASDYLGKGLLLPVLRELFASRAPLRFEISTTHSLDAPRSVERGAVDFAVITTLETKEGLTEKLLFTQPFLWVGPRVKGERIPFKDRLRSEPVLRLGTGSQGRRLLDHFLDEQRIRPVSTIDVPSVSLLLSYASGGLGVGLCPALALSDASSSRIVSERAAVPALPVKLVYRSNYRITPAAQRFVDRVVAVGRDAAQQH
ncbi:MAG TPA: LysR family transcriptional regulator [Polyangiaceae bacterium]|nr:LysR family transcriptional regulator [Polyangiaceae bacterium]